MRVGKFIRKPVRWDRDGVRLVGGLGLTISANFGENGSQVSASNEQVSPVTQQGDHRSRTHTGAESQEEVEHD